MNVNIGKSKLELVEGDITVQDTDAIVNAANPTLLGGGGVDGAIHRRAGPGLLEECENLPEIKPGIRCSPGEAKITKGYHLKARYVIHTVGPVYHGGKKGEPEILKNCYYHSLELACEKGLKSIAFPSISTGVYGYPVASASGIALGTIWDYLKEKETLQLVKMVLFGEEDYNVYVKTLLELKKKRESI